MRRMVWVVLVLAGCQGDEVRPVGAARAETVAAPEAAQEARLLVGVEPGMSFADASRRLDAYAVEGDTSTVDGSSRQYLRTVETAEGRATITSGLFPSAGPAQTPVEVVVLETSAAEHGAQAVRTVYDTYRARFNRLLGPVQPERFELGRAERFVWTWRTDSMKVQVAYETEGGLPRTTRIHAELMP